MGYSIFGSRISLSICRRQSSSQRTGRSGQERARGQCMWRSWKASTRDSAWPTVSSDAHLRGQLVLQVDRTRVNRLQPQQGFSMGILVQLHRPRRHLHSADEQGDEVPGSAGGAELLDLHAARITYTTHTYTHAPCTQTHAHRHAHITHHTHTQHTQYTHTTHNTHTQC